MALENLKENLEDMLENVKKLKIWTSESTKERIDELVENNILPIFILGISKKSPFARWRNTMVHFLELSPDPALWKRLKNKEISSEEFKKAYLSSLWRNSDAFHILEQFEILTHLACSDGLCIVCGMDEMSVYTREAICDYFNKLGILENEVKEWSL